MDDNLDNRRRSFLCLTTSAGASLLFSGCARSTQTGQETKDTLTGEKDEGVSPAEDLMREHGVLERILLIYEEGVRRIQSRQNLEPAELASAVGIVRRFIEDYHEKLEEDHLFPRFEKAGKLVELVMVLRQQHQAGRRVTEKIQRLLAEPSLKKPDERRKIVDAFHEFIRMYRPHAAREDTVLFPAIHELVNPKEYDLMGEQFEDQEHKLFGENGFEKIVAEVAGIERKLGIEDLARFTPAK
jgi:hemerythrin-like domain-containing protein